MTEDEWRFIVDINLTEAFQGCRALGPHLLARRQGAVVNISGWASFRGRAGSAAYDAAKAGVMRFTESLAQEWAPSVYGSTPWPQAPSPIRSRCRRRPTSNGMPPPPRRSRSDGWAVERKWATWPCSWPLPRRPCHRTNLGCGWRGEHPEPVSELTPRTAASCKALSTHWCVTDRASEMLKSIMQAFDISATRT